MRISAIEQHQRIDRLEQKVFAEQQKVALLRDSVQSLQGPHEKRQRWLTRVLISETDRASEMVYVANVVRNRVVTAHNGEDTYKGVILHPFAFSAFNPNSPLREYYMNLEDHRRWDKAKRIADAVLKARRPELPLLVNVTHFYSPVSMKPRGRQPLWAKKKERVNITTVDDKRFRFYGSSQNVR